VGFVFLERRNLEGAVAKWEGKGLQNL
jgi:hypothetical protein